VPTIF